MQESHLMSGLVGSLSLEAHQRRQADIPLRAHNIAAETRSVASPQPLGKGWVTAERHLLRSVVPRRALAPPSPPPHLGIYV